VVRYAKIVLFYAGSSHVPIWRDPRRGFGRLLLDPVATKQATKTALEVGFDTSIARDAYRNEKAIDASRWAIPLPFSRYQP
jgi:hypothetical protein